jgi:NitT/TauT family transport system substrate-binding protein
MMQSRRGFVGSVAAAGLLSSAPALAAEGPLETTTVRLRVEDVPPNSVDGVVDFVSCYAPEYVAQELLSAEGFTDVRYVPVQEGGCAYAGVRARRDRL